MTIEEIVRGLRSNTIRRPDLPASEWESPTRYASSFSKDRAGAQECDIATGGHCPQDLKEFWQLASWGKIFEDVTTQQWGLEILTPEEAVIATNAFFERAQPKNTAKGDVILGRFIGDSDLLLVRADPQSPDFGRIIVVTGVIDPRPDWEIVAESFGEFLNRYVAARGDRYWS